MARIANETHPSSLIFSGEAARFRFLELSRINPWRRRSGLRVFGRHFAKSLVAQNRRRVPRNAGAEDGLLRAAAGPCRLGKLCGQRGASSVLLAEWLLLSTSGEMLEFTVKSPAFAAAWDVFQIRAEPKECSRD